MIGAADDGDEAIEVVAGHAEGGGGGELAAALLEAIALAARIHVLLVEAPKSERRAVEARRAQAIALIADWPSAPPPARPAGFRASVRTAPRRRR